METGNQTPKKKKKKVWPWILLGIGIGLLLAVILLFIYYWNEDDGYYEDGYYEDADGNYYYDDGGQNGDRGFGDDGYGPGPDFGGEDSWDQYSDWDDYYDENWDSDASDGWFESGEGNSGWSGGSYDSYVSSSDIFNEDDYPAGLAVRPEGNVILYSMFVDYDGCTWDFNDSSDAENEAYVERELAIAVQYLEDEAARYGKSLNIIYDWGQDPDLCCQATMSGDFVSDDCEYYGTTYYFIDENLASTVKDLEDKYDAESVVFMVYLNTPNSLQQTSCTFPKWAGKESGGEYEVCFMHTRSYDEYESAAGYAHEICHAFGAPDLYTADTSSSGFGITQEYVNYCEETNSNDLMYTTYNAQTNATEYDHISNEITDITAYYLGWTDSSETVSEWGFDSAEVK